MGNKKVKKSFSLTWVFSPFEEVPSFWTRRMFGGLAAYVHDKMVMVLTEGEGEREWKGKKFDFDIWNGILIPTDREHHDSLQTEFSSLVSHPVLGKWLYLPMQAEDFELTANKIAKKIAANDHRLGVYPKEKSKKKKSKKITTAKNPKRKKTKKAVNKSGKKKIQNSISKKKKKKAQSKKIKKASSKKTTKKKKELNKIKKKVKTQIRRKK